jgi:Rrf2 family iron-sulfur cluster assembly transcriptional regulator
MQLTRAGEYAIRCILYLTMQDSKSIIKRKAIAANMEIPSHFLSKIAQQLARAGLIEINQGAKGGYRLLRPPEKITMLDVIQAVEGGIVLNQCLLNHQSCDRTKLCEVHQVWHRAQNALREVLGDANFRDLAKKEISRSGASAGAKGD